MTVEKDGKTYTVRENKTSWTVLMMIDNVNISYNISKVDCSTFNEVEAYIATSDLF